MAFPESEGEWSELLAGQQPLVALGAQSSLTGGATPAGAMAVATAGLTEVLQDRGDRLRVQPGLSLVRLLELLQDGDRSFPPVPTHLGATCGGVVSTNASGARTFKHGSTRPWVTGLTVGLAGGELIDLERGQCLAEPGGVFELERAGGGRLRLPAPVEPRPAVPKCAAGHLFAPADGSPCDLIDLFIGSEGTLGLVLEVELAVRARDRDELLLAVPFADVLTALRRVELLTRSRDLDLAGIEHLDGACLRLLNEEGIPGRLGFRFPDPCETVLLLLVDLPRSDDHSDLVDQLAATGQGASTPLSGLFAALADDGVELERIELALPGDHARREAFFALRESAPELVNHRIGHHRQSEPRLHKVGGDPIVPVECLPELIGAAADLAEQAALELVTWGHASDGHLHPNVIPRDYDELRRGEELQLALGRLAIELGGAPLAEHGVGRHPIKQRLLAEFLGPEGLARARAMKRALDPRGILAPGVLLPS